MTDKKFDRREFLKYSGTLGALGLSGLSGCMMTEGSMAPNMKPLMSGGGINTAVVEGAPAKGEYPAAAAGETQEVLLIAYENDTNNYHFMPHVAWIEPGAKVKWHHTNKGISEDRTHTTTAITPNTMPGYPRLIPFNSEAWDSGFMPGAMKSNWSFISGDDRTADNAVKDNPKPGMIEHGPHVHKFTEKGVYIYLCQNHFGFGMAGAIVVGDLYSQTVQGMSDAKKREIGWAPGMTNPVVASKLGEEDPRFAKTIAGKINNAIRPFIWNGKKSKKKPPSPPWA